MCLRRVSLSTLNGCFGSTADVGLLKKLVRFTPESGRKSVITGHPHIDRLFLAINSLCGGYGAPALDRAQGGHSLQRRTPHAFLFPILGLISGWRMRVGITVGLAEGAVL